MKTISTFETLKIKEYRDGKFGIYSLAEKCTIGPTFSSIEDLTVYAIEHYTDSYV